MTDEELFRAAEEFIYQEFRIHAYVTGYYEEDGFLVFISDSNDEIVTGQPVIIKYDGEKFIAEYEDLF